MKNEFLFKPKRGKPMPLKELLEEMDAIILNRINSDFSLMDKAMIEVFDQRKREIEGHGSGSLGRMSLRMVKEKFA